MSLLKVSFFVQRNIARHITTRALFSSLPKLLYTSPEAKQKAIENFFNILNTVPGARADFGEFPHKKYVVVAPGPDGHDEILAEAEDFPLELKRTLPMYQITVPLIQPK
ncbi:MAG TPA: hypothetical protein VHD33_00200 [Legionellaceae bacterium]|nr:hypothetical protein [Legionellaceae bacterium]